METKPTSTGCCPPLEPEKWDGQKYEWQDKKFVKKGVRCIFNFPLNYGGVMTFLDVKLRESGAQPVDMLCLSDHVSPWKMDLYLAVDKDVEGLENVTMSGTFYSKVYEGPFKNTGKWMKDFKKTLEGDGFKPSKIMMWYTTCPKCFKVYGKNYVVAFAQIK